MLEAPEGTWRCIPVGTAMTMPPTLPKNSMGNPMEKAPVKWSVMWPYTLWLCQNSYIENGVS